MDYARRRTLLAQARRLATAPDRCAVLRQWLMRAPDERAKLWVTWSVLRIRREMESLYRHPTHTSLEVRGAHADHLVAFAVHDERRCVVAVAPRVVAAMGLAAGAPPIGRCWHDTTLAWPAALARPATWADGVTDRRYTDAPVGWPASELLRDCPVAALSATFA